MPAPYWGVEPDSDPDSSLRFRFLESVIVLGAATASMRFRAIFAYMWLDGLHWVQGPDCSECLLNFLPAAAGVANQF
jgi:hypothetical protein